ncbi:hypothetical protein [Paraburkholderia tropica]|uniref:hypothetical protein n=1 Tax=Paraburkholderia tropica TaxID=92647 RepID=UPI0007EC6507|nr:hypothetical protein [Paraburkholderia tropica]OBR52370.1 hypothetical protein A6456_10760 [Paraburkholderia tropica]
MDEEIIDCRRTHRTLSDAFGPGSKLHIEEESASKGWAWAIFYGLVIGLGWYGLVALKAGA